MVKIGGGGPKAADTSGVARAHESVMQSHRDNASQAAQMGQTVTQAAGLVQKQGQIDSEQQARKDRLDVEMAKSDLEFRGEGQERKVEVTEAGQEKQAQADRFKASDAASKATRAAAYELSQRISLTKAGYSEDGVLNEEGQAAMRNLASDYKKSQKLFTRVANGDKRALQEAVGQTPDALQMDMNDPESFMKSGDGSPIEMGGAGMNTVPVKGEQAQPNMDRVVAGLRAKLDHEQLKFVVNTQGEMPDDVMMDSKAWQQFSQAQLAAVAIAKSGVMMPPTFKNVKERNRFFNEQAARAVLSGRPAPGSLTEGLTPAAGAPDDGTPQQSAPNEQLGAESVPPGTAAPGAGPVPNAGGWSAQN